MKFKKLVIFILILINLVCTEKYLFSSDTNKDKKTASKPTNLSFEEKIKKQIKEIEIFYNNKQFIEANNLCIATHQLMSSTNTSQELADYILIISLFSCARFYFKKNLFPKCYETLATANQHINRISNEPFKKHLLEILKSFNWNSLEEADDFCNFMLPGPALKNDKN